MFLLTNYFPLFLVNFFKTHLFCTLFWKVLMLSLLLLLLSSSPSLSLLLLDLQFAINGWAWCIFIIRHRGPNFWVTPRCRCSNTWLKSFARVLLVLPAPLAYFVFLALCLHVGVEQLWQDEPGPRVTEPAECVQFSPTPPSWLLLQKLWRKKEIKSFRAFRIVCS